jgi:hypothetical protein
MSHRVLPLWQLVTIQIAMALADNYRFSVVVMMMASFRAAPAGAPEGRGINPSVYQSWLCARSEGVSHPIK